MVIILRRPPGNKRQGRTEGEGRERRLSLIHLRVEINRPFRDSHLHPFTCLHSLCAELACPFHSYAVLLFLSEAIILLPNCSPSYWTPATVILSSSTSQQDSCIPTQLKAMDSSSDVGLEIVGDNLVLIHFICQFTPPTPVLPSCLIKLTASHVFLLVKDNFPDGMSYCAEYIPTLVLVHDTEMRVVCCCCCYQGR
ncbi:hypothetical protein CPB84DRAFT_414327 [Gymnopilus junonius]|uniref:Uncharacterized protein n=1 Tax=Gymnopilus junonius TaxID=109634 RepID=A0A9P5TGY9_GYMJU|nr:hypothetical protein CPB84DRAFT_414327 [Gymnopilus junonius]